MHGFAYKVREVNHACSFVNCDIQDEHATKKRGTSDIRELKSVYRAYRDYYIRHDKAFDLEQRYLSMLKLLITSFSHLIFFFCKHLNLNQLI